MYSASWPALPWSGLPMSINASPKRNAARWASSRLLLPRMPTEASFESAETTPWETLLLLSARRGRTTRSSARARRAAPTRSTALGAAPAATAGRAVSGATGGAGQPATMETDLGPGAPAGVIADLMMRDSPAAVAAVAEWFGIVSIQSIVAWTGSFGPPRSILRLNK